MRDRDESTYVIRKNPSPVEIFVIGRNRRFDRDRDLRRSGRRVVRV